MDIKIKNLKSKKKKKKKAEKKIEPKTILDRIALLNDEQRQAIKKATLWRLPKTFHDTSSKCCPGLQIIETLTYWPPFIKDKESKEYFWDLNLKFIE
jgi:hypothetical protein